MSRFVKLLHDPTVINLEDVSRFFLSCDPNDSLKELDEITVIFTSSSASAGRDLVITFDSPVKAQEAFDCLCSEVNLIRYRAFVQTGPRKPEGGWDKAYRSFDGLAGFGVCTESGT